MIIYLDQNKWIELSKMIHGKDSSARAARVVAAFTAATESSAAVVPVSAIHYMETARISNAGRRSRLGRAMWQVSRGHTMAAYQIVVRHELAVALSKHFPQVQPGQLKLIGRGSYHAFGMRPPSGLLAVFSEEVEKAMLCGSADLKLDPPSFRGSKHQENFKKHLEGLHQRSLQLPKDKVENWLYATLLTDIMKPFYDVFSTFGISKGDFEAIGESRVKALIDDMPTRHLDLHLHKQVLANPNYLAKVTDLEDWVGVGVAACYCDVVVCEKHMADMLRRANYKTKARVETDLEKTFVLLTEGA